MVNSDKESTLDLTNFGSGVSNRAPASFFMKLGLFNAAKAILNLPEHIGADLAKPFTVFLKSSASEQKSSALRLDLEIALTDVLDDSPEVLGVLLAETVSQRLGNSKKGRSARNARRLLWDDTIRWINDYVTQHGRPVLIKGFVSSLSVYSLWTPGRIVRKKSVLSKIGFKSESDFLFHDLRNKYSHYGTTPIDIFLIDPWKENKFLPAFDFVRINQACSGGNWEELIEAKRPWLYDEEKIKRGESYTNDGPINRNPYISKLKGISDYKIYVNQVKRVRRSQFASGQQWTNEYGPPLALSEYDIEDGNEGLLTMVQSVFEAMKIQSSHRNH